jgi:hypothetical protein
MHITSKTAASLYEACIQEVKARVAETAALHGKHAFHEAASFEILDPQLSKKSVSYDGLKFMHIEQSKIFDIETDHYNNLISSVGIESIVDCLKIDAESKKAYLSFWSNEFIFGKSGEIPCLTGVHFYIRENKVFCVVQMRSNELLSLLPVDICFGIALQTYVANSLGKDIGSYTHQVASLILYSADIKKLEMV